MNNSVILAIATFSRPRREFRWRKQQTLIAPGISTASEPTSWMKQGSAPR
jgi:hypothetical protein